jgi:iron complex outermembrane receptor protein
MPDTARLFVERQRLGYLVVEGYALANARVGSPAASWWTLFLWPRNLFDKHYFELLTAAPGNTGLYVGQPGDARTVGLTLRLAVKKGRRKKDEAGSRTPVKNLRREPVTNHS